MVVNGVGIWDICILRGNFETSVWGDSIWLLGLFAHQR